MLCFLLSSIGSLNMGSIFRCPVLHFTRLTQKPNDGAEWPFLNFDFGLSNVTLIKNNVFIAVRTNYDQDIGFKTFSINISQFLKVKVQCPLLKVSKGLNQGHGRVRLSMEVLKGWVYYVSLQMCVSHFGCIRLFGAMALWPARAPLPMRLSQNKNTGV